MGKIIAIVNQKKGTSKTTTAVNLSASLAALEYKVLVVDSDPQASCSLGLNVFLGKEQKSIYDCIIGNINIEGVIKKSNFKYLDIIPSNNNLSNTKIEMINIDNREERMKEILSPIKNKYDFIIIDCAPSLDLTVMNAMITADSVIVPLQCEHYVLKQLSKLLNTINVVQQRLNEKLVYEGILLTAYDVNMDFSNQIVEEVRKHFKNIVFKTIIPLDLQFNKSLSLGMPIIAYDAESKGVGAYLSLAREILTKNTN